MAKTKSLEFEAAKKTAEQFEETESKSSGLTALTVVMRPINTEQWLVCCITAIPEVAQAVANFLAQDAECDVEIHEHQTFQPIPSK